MKKPKLKKPRLLKVPKLPAVAGKLSLKPLRRSKAPEEKVSEALQNVPRITNETVAEHREDVLSSARKYIYPLQHSKHRVVRISISLFAAVLVFLFAYCGLALYRFQTTSGFIYGITRVVPFPVAKAGPNWVSYESYLFELRRNMHYYQTQQQADFSTKDGKNQLSRLKQQALAQVVEAAYVKQLASQHHVSVSAQAVDNEVALVRSQNRLGSSNRVFDEVLNQFWGWNESDFKRELRQQLLQQAVVAKLDTATDSRAQAALKQLQDGADFATVAAQTSDDTSTKANGGQYAAAITPSDANVPPQITAALFQLKAGQTSTIINSGYTLDIVKVISSTGTSVQAAHIQFTFQPITKYTDPLQAKEKPHDYIKV
jgi:parvulin-like peptidyl-prolyl isomerase